MIVFTIGYYRGPGIVATLALLINLALLVCILILFEATLTLPGIAGIVLTVGMAIDANILTSGRFTYAVDLVGGSDTVAETVRDFLTKQGIEIPVKKRRKRKKKGAKGS